MIRRITVLTGYFTRRLVLSLSGIMYLLGALVYWVVFFPPQQATPDIENYIIVIGAFGAAVSFLVTLTITGQANRAYNYPLLVRLPSRVEYLTAVLLAALLAAISLQGLVAVLALFEGPAAAIGRFLEIPPLWLAINVLAIVLALHASDFVTAGWSRVYIYGILAVLLVSQNGNGAFSQWLANRLNGWSATLLRQDWMTLGQWLNQIADWLRSGGNSRVAQLLGTVFWPFHAILDAVINGYFDSTQALAPAVLLLYATILFMLAADLFATKDIEFRE